MIISASRRTDIPALYSEWFMNRLRTGEVLTANPYNRKKVSRIRLSPEVVDCIVFWTKNPEPMLPYLKELDEMDYRYYFQMTITDYGKETEPDIPPTAEAMATFLLLSERIGKERLDWRFDPILLSDQYTISYHLEQFEMMCEWLHPATTRCIISFVDGYKGSPYLEIEPEDMHRLGEGIGKISRKYNLPVYTCAEKISLARYGIQKGSCIDKEKIQSLIGYKLDLKKDTGQRKECGCIQSIDIGAYDTCINGCRYCYARHGEGTAQRRFEQHDPQSPLLTGRLRGDEEITDREVSTSRDNQLSLFDLPEMYMDF